MSKLRQSKSEKVQQQHRSSEQDSETFIAVWNERIPPILPLIMAAAGRQYIPSNPTDCLGTEVIVRIEVEKDPSWSVAIKREKRRGVQNYA